VRSTSLKKYITVFFNGTGHAKDNPSFLANWLYALRQENESQLFMNFDGIGVVNPLMGTIFGTGMDKQCQEVIEKVRECVEAGDEVVLNVYGHSRGGISALMLAKQLSNINPSQLSIHLALHDPVPGNLLITPYFDAWEISLANKMMDLSMCKPLKKVLALYPHLPLMFHAPLFPNYPEHCLVDEIILPGCHAGAQYQGILKLDGEDKWVWKKPETDKDFLNPEFYNPESYIAFEEILTFLKNRNSSLKDLESIWYPGVNKNLVGREDAYEIANRNFQGSIKRHGHSMTGQYIYTKDSRPYFNIEHQLLSKDYSSKVTRSKFVFPAWFITNSVRDFIIGIIFATGFTAITFFASPLGLGLSVAIGISMAALTMSPIAKKAAEMFFYPHYQMQDFKAKVQEDMPSLGMNYA
jgi:hypothetical protein